MTTVTAIRELEIAEVTEVTTTCACGARAVVSNEDFDSCVTCAIHQWMQPEEIVAPTNEERLCVECGGAYLPLYDVQSHCGLCVEAMTSEEYEASSMGTDGTARSVLVQTWECGLCDVDYIPTTAVQRVSGLCASVRVHALRRGRLPGVRLRSDLLRVSRPGGGGRPRLPLPAIRRHPQRPRREG